MRPSENIRSALLCFSSVGQLKKTLIWIILDACIYNSKNIKILQKFIKFIVKIIVQACVFKKNNKKIKKYFNKLTCSA